MLQILLYGVIVLMALLFLVLGAGFWLDPVAAAGRMGLEAMSLTGMNALRGDLGGLFIASTVLLALGIWRREPRWWLAVAVLMGAIACGRLVGLAVDGVSPAAVTALGSEVAFVLILAYAARRQSALNARHP